MLGPHWKKRLAALVEGLATWAGHVTGLRRLRGKALLLHCERELWGPLEMACSGDLMPSTNPCPHVAHPPPPMVRPLPPCRPATLSPCHPGRAVGLARRDARRGSVRSAKGLGAAGWRSACGMPILPDSSLPPAPERTTWTRTTTSTVLSSAATGR